MTHLADKAEHLRRLHFGDHPLVLPNAWDAASAQAVVDAGYPVVATTSNAIAAALGHPDGEGAPMSEMLAVAQRIAASVDVPVTVDAEAGYGMPPHTLVERLVEIGASGCNVEDSDHRRGGLLAAEERAEYIAEMRAAARRIGVPVVINARVDVFFGTSQVPADERMSEAVRRSHLYHRAGADCIFPPGASTAEVGVLVKEIDAPVNAGLRLGKDSVADLRSLGVARISLGPQLYYRTLEGLRTSLGSLASQ